MTCNRNSIIGLRKANRGTAYLRWLVRIMEIPRAINDLVGCLVCFGIGSTAFFERAKTCTGKCKQGEACMSGQFTALVL